MDKLPIGDETLSAKEIIANESQERMGLLIDEKKLEHVRKIAERERAPMYVVGETTGDHRFAFEQADGGRPLRCLQALQSEWYRQIQDCPLSAVQNLRPH